MKINSLQISNVLSFKYFANIADAPEISFDKNLNIIIGENGAGKSTALEVLNFIFRRVIFKQYNLNQDLYDRKSSIPVTDKKQIVSPENNNSFGGFRLDPNWNTRTEPQKIKIIVELDDVDIANFNNISQHKTILERYAFEYTNFSIPDLNTGKQTYTIDIDLTWASQSFQAVSSLNDSGYAYLENYDFLKKLIDLHNAENIDSPLPPLYESFALIGGYRNYSNFSTSLSLGGTKASQLIQDIRKAEYRKSLNSVDQNEPPIFSLVRLLAAEEHYESDRFHPEAECERRANALPLIVAINKRLKVVNLECRIKCTDRRTWQYSFELFDIERGEVLNEINSLSAGQKAIIHLVFEAYGRGEAKGGLVIIDEPEIHLHYQLQNQYLRVIEDLNKEQQCQYILVTHSESLINSKTIDKVRRFALADDRSTVVKNPSITGSQRDLVKILDNTKSTYAFFSKKVILVEGDTDRYFFYSVLQELKPELDQEIAVLDIGGKGNYSIWKTFFESFGLKVYLIADFDNVFTLKFSGNPLIPASEDARIRSVLKQNKLKSQKRKLKNIYSTLTTSSDFLTNPKAASWGVLMDGYRNIIQLSSDEVVRKVKREFPNIQNEITAKYTEGVFILKAGNLENYTGTNHAKIQGVIDFCKNTLSSWLKKRTVRSLEIKAIINHIAND